MALKGMKHPVFAPFATEPEGQLPTYGAGAVVGLALEVNEAIEYNDAKLYGNNGLAESDDSFKKGKLTTGVDDLSKAIKKLWFGMREVSEGGVTVLKDAVAYVSPYGGFGYYSMRQKGSAVTIIAQWYYKTKWNRPNNEAKTTGESVEWKTPKVEGNIYAIGDTEGSWHKELECATEAEAVAWLDGLAGIVTPTALALSSSTPADAATGASKTAAITLTFNNVMNQVQTKFVLTNDTGDVITTTVAWDAAGKVATLTHSALTGTVKHHLVVAAVDAFGQALTDTVIFTTAA